MYRADAVRHSQLVEIPTLDSTGVTATLGNTRYVDLIACGEGIGGDRITNLMEKFDLDENTPIENKMLTKSIENAQTTVESRNFQSRKSVLEYDDVMNIADRYLAECMEYAKAHSAECNAVRPIKGTRARIKAIG